MQRTVNDKWLDLANIVVSCNVVGIQLYSSFFFLWNYIIDPGFEKKEYRLKRYYYKVYGNIFLINYKYKLV